MICIPNCTYPCVIFTYWYTRSAIHSLVHVSQLVQSYSSIQMNILSEHFFRNGVHGGFFVSLIGKICHICIYCMAIIVYLCIFQKVNTYAKPCGIIRQKPKETTCIWYDLNSGRLDLLFILICHCISLIYACLILKLP